MTNGRTLDVEITIDPTKSRRGQQPKTRPTVPTLPRIPRITRLMALAIKFEDLVNRGEVRDYADLARLPQRGLAPLWASPPMACTSSLAHRRMEQTEPTRCSA